MQAVLSERERSRRAESEREAEELRQELEACGQEADRQVEASFAEHVR